MHRRARRSSGARRRAGRRPSPAGHGATSVLVRPTGDVEAQHVEHAGQAGRRRPGHAVEVLGQRAATAAAAVDGVGHLVQRGCVRRHDDIGGTDVIEMSASAWSSSTGATVGVVRNGRVSPTVGGVVVATAVAATVVGAPRGMIGGNVGSDDVDAEGSEAHETVRSTKPTRHRHPTRNCCDLGHLTTGHGTAVALRCRGSLIRIQPHETGSSIVYGT